jgi:thiamine biosynthesis protein ThiI
MVNPRATHLLIRHHEIALKGKNRPEFERRLMRNISRAIGDAGVLHNMSGRFIVEPRPETRGDLMTMVEQAAAVSGVSAVAPCLVTEPALEAISERTLEWAQAELEALPDASTFAIRSRRVDKRFPLPSAQLDMKVGSAVKKLRPGMTVRLKEPDLKITIEVRDRHAIIYGWEREGARGLPMDSQQRVVCLLSGGIDSPVAAYELMRRGVTPIFVHFHSKPFTSEASIAKVKRLAGVLRKHSPYPLELWLVPLLDAQKAVRDRCNERLRTVHYRRFMMMIAQEIGARRGAKALATGDALGQVASQTLTNIAAIEDAISVPVLRPLIASDKQQIVSRAREIGTYEISIEPHDDTCILFAPERPSTQARVEALREGEELLPTYKLVFSAADAAEKVLI